MRNTLLYVALFVSNLVLAQVTFEASVSKRTLGVNERLRIDFKMNEDGDNFTPPSFENFKVVGGPSQSISNSWVNGVRSYSKSYTYFLTPTKRGVFTIEQSQIEVNGTIYKTSPIKITVTAAVEKPKDPNDPEYIAEKSIHLVAEISKTNPYINEAVSVVYKLYVAEKTGVRSWSELDAPRYNDFWSQNIAVNGLSVKEGQFKGENYRYVVLKKTVLYPQKSGKLTLEPLTLDVSVEVPSSRRDIFGRRVMSTANRTVTAGRRTINAKPLPEQGRPENFSGAVGKFDFEANVSRNSLIATEAFSLSIEVEGKGNLKLFELPKPNLPAALEIYEPERSENIDTSISGMRGSAADNYTVVPNEEGRYPIPSVAFSYFDIASESYKTLVSNQTVISVKPDPSKSAVLGPVSAKEKGAVVYSNMGQFSPFKTKTSLELINKPPFYGSHLFWALLLGPLVFIPLLIIYTKLKGKRALDITGNKIRKNNKLARKHLSEAKKSMGKKELFYIALERALHNYLKAKLKIETCEFSKGKIKLLLTEKAVVDDDASGFLGLLEACELARYTPLKNSDMKRDYIAASEIISRLDKQLR
jgi:hypothetical protein